MIAKLKAGIGFLVYPFWTGSMYLSIYIFYRLIRYQELWLLITFILTLIYQFNCTKSMTLVRFFKWLGLINYFDEHQIIEVEKPKKSGALFGIHPHGIYNVGLTLNLDAPNTFFENLIPLGTRVVVNAPIAGIILRLLYGMQSIDSNNLERLLKLQKNVALVPGGFEEKSLGCKHENRLYIIKRKGFIKYALKYGTTLYPVFTFGENQLFHTFDNLTTLKFFINKLKIVGNLYVSRFIILPEPRTKMVTVCGKGIECPQLENPSKEDIDKYHQLYLDQLKEIYDTYGPKYAPGIPLVLY